MLDDEFVHVLKQIGAQSQIEHRPFVYAHVSNYDPSTNSVRVIVPSMVDDQTGAPVHSGWLPLGTQQVGAQSGIQIVPLGGATATNPTQGELCLVGLNERGTGVAAVICMFFTNAQKPPHTVLPPNAGLQPGDVMIRHFPEGSVIWLQNTGKIVVNTGGDGEIDIGTSGTLGVNVTTTGAGSINLEVSGGGSINISASGSGTLNLNSAQTVVLTAPNTTVNGNMHVTGKFTNP